MRMMAEAGGEPMRAGRSEAEWATLLQAHGFLLYENLTDADIERRYFAGRTACMPSSRFSLRWRLKR